MKFKSCTSHEENHSNVSSERIISRLEVGVGPGGRVATPERRALHTKGISASSCHLSSACLHPALFSVAFNERTAAGTFCPRHGEEELVQKVSEDFVLQERRQPERVCAEGGGQDGGSEEEVQVPKV